MCELWANYRMCVKDKFESVEIIEQSRQGGAWSIQS